MTVKRVVRGSDGVVAAKECTGCGRVLPVTDFHPKGRGDVFGVTHWAAKCRDCARRPKVRGNGPSVPVEPLAERINAYLENSRFGFSPNELQRLGLESPIEFLVRESGVNERSILRIRRLEQRRVRVDIADRLCIALGITLSLLYPEDLDRAA